MEILEFVRITMWVTGTATLIVTVGLGIVLSYHWMKYSGNTRSASASIILYSFVSAVLVLWMFGSIPV